MKEIITQDVFNHLITEHTESHKHNNNDDKTIFKNKIFVEISFDKRNIENTIFIDCDFTNCTFNDAVFRNVAVTQSTFNNCKFSNTIFSQFRFYQSVFYNAVFDYCNFSETILKKCEFTDSTISKTAINFSRMDEVKCKDSKSKRNVLNLTKYKPFVEIDGDLIELFTILFLLNNDDSEG